MSFFDKVKGTANAVANKTKEAGSSISSATKTAVEKQKIKNAIGKENSNIEKQYNEIGKKYVELFSGQPAEEFAEYLTAIETSKAEIEKLNVQLNALEDCIVCACGAKVSKNSSFCPTCGNAIVVDTTTVETTAEEVTTVEEEPVVETVEAEEVPTEDTTTDTTTEL